MAKKGFVKKTLEKAEKVVETVVPGMKKEPEMKPTDMVSKIRANGEEMASILMGINFHESKLMDKDLETDMKALRGVLVSELRQSATITDDVRPIDVQLKFAANSWAASVKEGYPTKATWAMAAMTQGIRKYRQNIPEDKADMKAEVMASRLEPMKAFHNIIEHAECVDTATRNIENARVDMKKHLDEYAPYFEKVNNLKSTPEGMVTYGNLITHRNDPQKLNDKDQEFLADLRHAASLAHTIQRKKAILFTESTKQETHRNQLEDWRNALYQNPVYNEAQMAAEHKKLLDDMNKRVEETLAIANMVRKNIEASDAELRKILSNHDAQGLNNSGYEWMQGILEHTVEDNAKSLRIAKLTFQGFDKTEEMNKARLEAVAQEILEAKLANEVTQEVTVEVVNEADTSQYNFNN